jgi:hypothetical protein
MGAAPQRARVVRLGVGVGVGGREVRVRNINSFRIDCLFLWPGARSLIIGGGMRWMVG